jgi:hypothetical protein
VALHRHSAKTRDAALRRLSTLNRLTAVGAVALALGFTAMAAAATPPRHAVPATVVATDSGATRSTAVAPADHVARHRRRHRHHRQAQATAGRHTTTAAPQGNTAPAPAPAPAPAQSAPRPAPAQPAPAPAPAQPAPAPAPAPVPAQPAPAPTPQPPVVVSGGS